MDENKRQSISYLESIYGMDYYLPTNSDEEKRNAILEKLGVPNIEQNSSLVSGFNMGYEPFQSKDKYIKKAKEFIVQNEEGLRDRIYNGLDSNRKIAVDGNNNPIFNTINSGKYKHLNSTIHEVNRYLVDTKAEDRIYYDLETVGAAFREKKSGNRGIYDITEIAMVNYHANGKVNYEKSFLSFSKLSNENESRLQRMIDNFEKDPHYFAKLTPSEQRQLVDLMRYSAIPEQNTKAFGLRLQAKTGLPIITHNEMVENEKFKIFKANGEVNTNKIIREYKTMIKHMRDGIRSIQDNEHSVSPEESARRLKSYLSENVDKQFISYNGKVFDMPLIQEYLTDFEAEEIKLEAKAKNSSLSYLESYRQANENIQKVIPKKHLDMYRVVEAYYNSIDDILERLGYESDSPIARNIKLQNLGDVAQIVGGYVKKEDGAHNALDDTDTLRRLTSVIMKNLKTFVKDDILPTIPEGAIMPDDIPKNVTQGRIDQNGEWFRHFLKEREELVANRSIMGMNEYDPLSFVLKKDGTTQYPIDVGFDGYVLDQYGEGGKIISAEATYKFNGFLDLTHKESKDPIKAAVLEDTTTGSLSFIVRTGNDAHDELTAILQENFYSNELGYGEKALGDDRVRKYAKERAKDRARNYYSTLFQNTDGGRGLYINSHGKLEEKSSAGYIAAKKVYGLAKEIDKEDLSNETTIKTIRQRAEELLGSEKRATHFMLGLRRYKQEADMYNSFFKSSDSHFNSKIQEVLDFFEEHKIQSGDDGEFYHNNKDLIKEMNNQLREINIQRNYALHQFHSYVEDTLDELNGEEARKVNVERAATRGFAIIKDAELDREYKIDILNQGNAEKTLRDMIYSNLPKDADNKSHAADVAARINSITNAIHNAGYITGKMKKELTQNYINNPTMSVNEYIRDVVVDLREAQHIKNIRKVKVTDKDRAMSLTKNPGLTKQFIKTVVPEMIDSSIKQSQSVLLDVEIHENVSDGNMKYVNVKLSKTMDEFLNMLDVEREHSVLRANNKQNVERVLNELIKQFPGKSVLTKISRGEGGREPSISFTVVPKEKAFSALNNLHKDKKVNSRIFEFSMPLVNEAGYMRLGGMRVNANMFTKPIETFSGKSQIGLVSSMDLLGDSIVEALEVARVSALSQKPDARSQAERGMADVINKTIQKFAGRVAGAPVDNGQEVIGNAGDFAKQNLVKFNGAIVQDILAGNYNRVTLRPEPNSGDFHPSAYEMNSNGELVLKKDVTELDLSLAKQDEIQALRADWWEERKSPEFKDVKLSIGATKSSQAIDGLSAMNTKEFYPKGLAYSTRRDPLVQALQAVPIQGDLEDRLKKVNGISLNQSYMSQKQMEMMGTNKIPDAFEARAVYMTNDQMTKRLKNLFADETTRSQMKKLEIFEPASKKLLENIEGLSPEAAWGEAKVLFDESGNAFKLNYSVLPNMYEQQAGVSEDLYNALQIQNNKTYSTKGRIEYPRWLEEGMTIQPGQQIGYTIDDRNYKQPLVYEGKNPAKVNTMSTKSINLTWHEQAFKIFGYGEKMTIQSVKQGVIDLLTGQTGVKVIHAGDIFRHEESGHFLNMQMHAIAKELAEEKDPLKKSKMIEAIKQANTGDNYNEKLNLLVDSSYQEGVLRPGQDIQKLSESIYNLVGATDNDGVHIFPETLKRRDIEIGNGDFAIGGVEQIRIAHLYNHSKSIDDTGFKVLGENKKGRIYSSKRDGVSYSTREVMALRGAGLYETIKHIEDQQLEQNTAVMPIRPGSRKGISFKEEAKNLVFAAQALTNDQKIDPTNVLHYNLDDFVTHIEPGKGDYSVDMFKESPFDGAKIVGDAEREGKTTRGYYLNLPVAQDIENGKVVREVKPFMINEKGEKVNVDKVFIPVIHLTNTDGQTYLNELDKNVRSIINNARAVQEGENYEERAKATERLSNSLARYTERLKFDLTSSKGYVADNIVKTRLAESSSGRYKLMDSAMTRQFQKEMGYDGEFTIINKQQAALMGLYDGMSAEDIEEINAGTKSIYGMHMRAPAFHPGAIQPIRVFVDTEDKYTAPGEFRTSTLASIIKNADSDGDDGYLTVIKNENVQKEWANFDARKEKNLKRYVDKYMKGIDVSDTYQRLSQGSSGDSIRDLLGEDVFNVEHDNTKSEVVAKTWKSIVGIASDINFEAKQFISFGLESGIINEDEAVKMNSFYDIVEQKIINSKHGAEGVAAQMLNHLKSGRFGEFEQVANRYYGELIDGLDEEGNHIQIRSNIFNTAGELDETRKRMPMLLENFQTSNESKASIVGTRFGTSTGVRKGTTLEEIASILTGAEESVGAYSETNHFIRTVQNLVVGEENVSRIQINPSITERTEARTARAVSEEALRSAAISGEALSVAKHNSESAAAKAAEEASKLSGDFGSSKRSMMVGAGIAMAGLFGYNIAVSNRTPPEMSDGRSQQYKQIYGGVAPGKEDIKYSQNYDPDANNYLGDFEYNTQSFGGHTVQGKKRTEEDTYQDGQEPNAYNAQISIMAKGANPINAEVSQWVNSAIANSNMNISDTSINLTTTDNIKRLNRVWYRDQIDKGMQ